MEQTQEDSSPGRQQPSGAPVKARLKWFNGPKGFGFVNPEDRPGVDAFLHVTVLQRIGVQMIGEGAHLSCIIEYGERGAHVREVLAVLEEGAVPAARIADGDGAGDAYQLAGAVKWYKPEDGFGFVVPDDGLKDVFIHKTCLERQGLASLAAGQRVLMIVRNVAKGREVVSFEMIGANAES